MGGRKQTITQKTQRKGIINSRNRTSRVQTQNILRNSTARNGISSGFPSTSLRRCPICYPSSRRLKTPPSITPFASAPIFILTLTNRCTVLRGVALFSALRSTPHSPCPGKLSNPVGGFFLHRKLSLGGICRDNCPPSVGKYKPLEEDFNDRSLSPPGSANCCLKDQFGVMAALFQAMAFSFLATDVLDPEGSSTVSPVFSWETSLAVIVASPSGSIALDLEGR